MISEEKMKGRAFRTQVFTPFAFCTTLKIITSDYFWVKKKRRKAMLARIEKNHFYSVLYKKAFYPREDNKNYLPLYQI
jgi:hypothetical protein